MFYSVALKDGRVNAWFGTGPGQQPTKLISPKRYDDGEIHSVSVYRNGGKSVDTIHYLLLI